MIEKKHTTNYTNSFISVSPDSKARVGIEPEVAEKPSLARRIYELIAERPYELTSDEVLIQVQAAQQEKSIEEVQDAFYAKGQPCLRSSLLVKKYGWGIHFNEEQKIALVDCASESYRQFTSDPNIAHYAGMRSKRAQ